MPTPVAGSPDVDSAAGALRVRRCGRNVTIADEIEIGKNKKRKKRKQYHIKWPKFGCIQRYIQQIVFNQVNRNKKKLLKIIMKPQPKMWKRKTEIKKKKRLEIVLVAGFRCGCAWDGFSIGLNLSLQVHSRQIEPLGRTVKPKSYTKNIKKPNVIIIQFEKLLITLKKMMIIDDPIKD